MLRVLLCPFMVLLTALAAMSQPLTVSPERVGPYTVSHRNAHLSIYQRITARTNAAGRLCCQTNTFTTLATGLSYFDEVTQRWLPSRPEWQVYPDGIVAQYGRAKVVLATNLNLSGSVDVLGPNGIRLISNPVGLGLWDPVDGKHTLLSEIKDCAPQRGAATNEIVFRDCFQGLRGSIRYLVTRAGFHQHVVLEQSLTLPPGFSDKTRLECYTEFAPETVMPRAKRRVLRAEQDPLTRAGMAEPDFTDDELGFGSLSMRAGTVFELGSTNGSRAVRVGKKFEVVNGRPVLTESVEFKLLEPMLARLAAGPASTSGGLAVNGSRRIPHAAREAGLPRDHFRAYASMEQIQLAASGLDPSSVVVDYELLESEDFFTFQGGTTYLVEDAVNILLPTIQAGAVVKFSTNGLGQINFLEDIVCETDDWTPATFTSYSDDSVGDVLPGSTGVPARVTGGVALDLSDEGGTFVLENVRFSHLGLAFGVYRGSSSQPYQLRNAQFIDCTAAIQAYALNMGYYVFQNLLVDRCDVAIAGFVGSSEPGEIETYISGEHLTVSRCDRLLHQDFGYTVVGLTNCVLAAVTNWANLYAWYDITTNNVVKLASDAGVFQIGPAGSHYLSAGSTNRNAGTTNINAQLLAAIQQMTTYPPPPAISDTNPPDLGFHYPLETDYDFDGLEDSWEWKHFGTLEQTAVGDFDGDGIDNGMEYTNHTDPNTIKFWVFATNQHVNASSLPISLVVLGGVPASMAVLLDSTNSGAAAWTTFSSNATVNLGVTNGWHELWVGARGRLSTSEQSWQWTRVKLDTVSPLLVLTSPSTTNCSLPIIQLQGYSLKALRGISFDITNAAGLLTNQPIFITSQATDTNKWEFSTNYFQGFDILLTNGSNSIAVHATDLAGNSTTTNVSFTLDYSSATNPPVIQISWPQNGTKISGTNFTWDGWVDDPAATVIAQSVNTNGVTNIFNALVGRNGKFWIEDLPLNSGTNDWTLFATNSAGNTSATNISVIKSALVLTIDPVSPDSQLWQPTVNVSGTISDASYSVSVNGVQGTNNGDGTWSASNVPVSNAGTASFEAAASSGTNAPTTVKANQDKPSQVVLVSGAGSTARPFPNCPTSVSTWQWNIASGGKYSFIRPLECDLVISEYYEWWGTNGASYFESWVVYSDTGPELVDFGTNSFPGIPAEIGSLKMAASPYTDYPFTGYLTRNSRATVQLRTGGKSGSKLKHVFALPASATAYQKLTTDEIPQPTDSWTVPYSAITIPGATWLDNNGIAYGIYPDDSTVDITPHVSVDYYSFSVSATKYKSYLTLYARMPDPNGCSTFVGTDAGHAWWRFTTEASAGAIGMFMGTNYSYYIGRTAGFYPDGLTWILPLGGNFTGVTEVPDTGNEGTENAQKTYEIGFDDLKGGIFFTKHLHENPPDWNGLFYNCVHAARGAAAAAGVKAPYAVFPETFGHKLLGDDPCP